MSNTRKQTVKLSVLASAVLLGMSAVSAHAAELKTVDRPVAGEYIVVLKKEVASLTGEVSLMGGVRRSPVATIAQQMARSHNGRLLRTYKKALRGFVVKADDMALARLLADNRVAYVQENGIVELFDTQANAIWSLDRIDQRDLPLSGSYTYDTTAAGVHAYVIDTGIRADHTEFTGRLGAGFTSELDGRGTEDCQGHGTHVAGTVGGTRWGVAKGVTVHPVRVFGCGDTTTGDKILAGIDWVTENHVKPAVVNMSLGGPADQAEDDAVQAMIDAGVITVVAAGNNNGDACLKSPARLPAAITVGATMSNDRRPDSADWGFTPTGAPQGSNFGVCLDIFAPGDNITSASRTGSQASTSKGGTSMAAPAVAGAAALYLAVHPLATQAEVSQALINGASVNKVTNQGAGSPNRLLYSLFEGGNPPGNVAPVANFSSTVTGLVVQFTDSSTDSDGNIASRLWTFGDGTTSTAPSPKKTYTAAGTYTVSLKVTDDDGATHTKTASVTVAASGGTVLTNGVAKTGLSGAAGTSQYFTLVVPAGATNLKFVTTGGTGDLDLFAQLGSQPTASSFACKSEGSSNAETCTVAVAQAGTYHVLVKGYSAFSGASLTGSYTAGGSGTQTYSNANDYTINDGVTVDSPITVSGRSGNAPTNASVAVAIVHSFQGDLKVDLVAPDGSLYNIHNRSGGATDDINKTVTLNLSTEALNGTWKLRVNDAGPGDVGKIDSWSITF